MIYSQLSPLRPQLHTFAMMKIVQFTDVHIGHEGEVTRDVDVRENFLRILEAVSDEKADHVVLSGDLCFKEPNVIAYEWVIAALKKYGLSPFVIPGNHDDNAMLSNYFPLECHAETMEIFYKEDWEENTTALFLDTGQGDMSDLQLDWLRAQLVVARRSLVIFIHYPPFSCGVPFMDQVHGFQRAVPLTEVLRSSGRECHLFCGHYHLERTVSLENIHVHITPSCFFQIDAETEDFVVDHHNIGYRIIQIDGNKVEHTVRYLPGKKLDIIQQTQSGEAKT